MLIFLVYESETLGVLSICIDSKDEDRIHLTVKYHDYKDKILTDVSVLIDRKNNVIWISGEKDGWKELREVIRNAIIIQDKTEAFPEIFLNLRSEVDKLLAFYYKHCKDEEIEASWKYPNIFHFFEITKEK